MHRSWRPARSDVYDDYQNADNVNKNFDNIYKNFGNIYKNFDSIDQKMNERSANIDSQSSRESC